MEPQFELRFYCDQRRLTEFYRKVALGPRPVTVGIMAAVYLVLLMRSILWGILGEMIPMLLFAALIFTLIGFMPEWFSWNILRQTKKQNDGQIPETVVTVGDYIELHEGMARYTIEYRKIVKVVSLKRSYVLMLGRRNGVILDPTGFTKGSFGDFKDYLRNVRPDLVIPD